MTDEPIKEDPVEKFRKLIASFIPLARLPKKNIKQDVQEISEVNMDDGKDALSSLPKKSAQPSDKLGALPKKADAAPKKVLPPLAATPAPAPSPASKPAPKVDSAPAGGYAAWAPRLWTTASVISLTINILLAIILIILII
ncbi:MAG: hypothetical protein RIR73_2759, partial [Chloroflexota bacterium]